MRLKEIAEDDIYDLVGSTLAGRGYDYYESGMVLSLTVRGGSIRAEVAGRSAPSYIVKIWCDADGVDGTCTCPYSQGVDVCKHVAAVLFEWVYERAAESADPAISEAELRQGLENLSKTDLIALILEAAMESDSLYQKLLPYNVKVTALCPSAIATDMTKEFSISQDKMIDVDDIVKTINFVLSLGDNACVPEVCIRCKEIDLRTMQVKPFEETVD